MGIVINSNLFDSIVNEVEKITHYEAMFSKLTPAEMSEVKDVNFDYDILGFMYCSNHAILTDKMLRSFVDLEYAVKRNYEESAKHAKRCDMVRFDESLMFHVAEQAKQLITMIKRKTIYTDEKVENASIVNFFKEEDEYYKTLTQANSRIVSMRGSEFEEVIEDVFKHIKTLFLLFRTELESKPYLRQTYFILKYTIGICLGMSYIHSSVLYE